MLKKIQVENGLGIIHIGFVYKFLYTVYHKKYRLASKFTY